MEAATASSEVSTDSRLELAQSLVIALQQGDEALTENTITELARSCESSLFNEIGQLARQVHDALGFCGDDERISEIAQNEIPDARERLRYRKNRRLCKSYFGYCGKTSGRFR